MGHLAAKDVYSQLGSKIDNLHVRAPNKESFYNLIKSIYSEKEADIVIKMPFLFSNIDRISKLTKTDKVELQNALTGLCRKGLVMDIFLDEEYRYMPSPLFVGIFEFTMMRTQGQLDMKEWARLFTEYLDEGTIYRQNFAQGSQMSIARAVPYEEAIGDHVEVLEYERVTHLIEEADRYAVGICSCRHKKDHVGKERCNVPLNTCTTLGKGADYLIRNGLSEEISKSEMFELFERSRELGLIFSADNVQKRLMFICHCCGCCCGIMDGINKHGLSSVLVTSTLIAEIDSEICDGCGKCTKACHIKAIKMERELDVVLKTKRKKRPVIDTEFCLGCGVCYPKCETGALQLKKRSKRVIHPETTFERVILQCLERGTLQNQLFDNPNSISQNMMRPLVGGFLKLSPVKKALMSDTLRSVFLSSMATGVKILGKGYIHEL